MESYSYSIPKTLSENSQYLLKILSIKKFSIKQRIRTYYLIKMYLQNHHIKTNECLKKIEKGSAIYSILQDRELLEDSSDYIYSIGDNNLLILVKQIGTESVNGIIFKVVGNIDYSFEKSIIISCKIMRQDEDNKKEIKILNLLTQQILDKKNIHFPISYFSSLCKEPHGEFSHYPELTETNNYYINLNEIADGDVSDLLENKEKKNKEFYNNLIAQIIITIFSFHKLGYTHNDTHCGNFLYHIITKSNSHFEYNILSNNYYIKNIGFLIVLWDFATSEKYYEDDYYKDYIKIFESIIYIVNEDGAMNHDILFLDGIISYLKENTNGTEENFIKFILTLNIFNNTKLNDSINLNRIIKL